MVAVMLSRNFVPCEMSQRAKSSHRVCSLRFNYITYSSVSFVSLLVQLLIVIRVFIKENYFTIFSMTANEFGHSSKLLLINKVL